MSYPRRLIKIDVISSQIFESVVHLARARNVDCVWHSGD